MGNQAVEIGKRNLNIKDTHWELLDLDNLKFEKPTVLCLCGNDTTTNAKANGFVKQAEIYLELMFKTKDGSNVLDNVDLVGVKYDEKNSMPIQDSEKVANAIFNLLIDKNGKKLDIETARKNMSRLTFFTYCYGHNVLQMDIVDKALNSKLSDAGYSENEINLICNSTLEVSYAPPGWINKIPSIRVMSSRDEMFSFPDTSLFENYNKTIDDLGVSLHEDKPGQIFGEDFDKATAGCIQIVSSGILNDFYQKNLNGKKQTVGLTTEDPKRKDHGVYAVARDQNWNLKDAKVDGVFYHSQNADCVSEMMAWALCKGVENSVQNFISDKYVPNTYWNEMVRDLQSIIDSYDHEKLLSKPQDLGIER